MLVDDGGFKTWGVMLFKDNAINGNIRGNLMVLRLSFSYGVPHKVNLL